MRPIEKMRADALAAIKNYTSGPYPMSAEDVLDLLAVVEAADGLAEAAQIAWTHLDDLREAWRTGAVATNDGNGLNRANHNVEVEVGLRNALSRYAAAKGKVTG